MNILEQAHDICDGHDMHLNDDPYCGPYGLILKFEEAGLFRSDPPEEGEVMAFRTTGNNSHLIEDAFKLGYLTDQMAILDPTYGMGVFWKRHRPPFLIGTDLDPSKSPGGAASFPDDTISMVGAGLPADFTDMAWHDGQFDAVVFDPDYKMQGTDSGQGPAMMNPRYGMARDYRTVSEQLGIIGQGLSECVRVTKPGGVIAVKHMDQVVSGSTVFQTDLVLVTMDELQCAKFAEFHLEGHRKQPTHDKCRECDGSGYLDWERLPEMRCKKCGGEGKVPRRQVHERHNFSTLALYRKAAK